MTKLAMERDRHSEGESVSWFVSARCKCGGSGSLIDLGWPLTTSSACFIHHADQFQVTRLHSKQSSFSKNIIHLFYLLGHSLLECEVTTPYKWDILCLTAGDP